MRDAVIVGVGRTALGKMKKTLSGIAAPDLAAMVMKKVVEDAKINPADLDDVIFGNLFNSEYCDLARVAVLTAGWPVEVPAVTIDRQCSSGLNAIAIASALIASGANDIILAGGVESHSTKPYLLKRPSVTFPDSLEFLKLKTTSAEYGFPTMILTAENVAKQYNISREECDEFAYASHMKAENAYQRGFYAGEVIPITIPQKKGEPKIFNKDEGIRGDISLESLAKLKPVTPGGVVTAGNACPMNDGAAAVLLMSREKAKEYGLEPLAKVGAFAAAGVDPRYMGIGPVYATRKIMKKTGLTINDFDIIELNEAFASQSLACIKELGIDIKKCNPNGGALAIGHPNAASGGILVTRAVRHMVEHDLKRGLISFCVGGGQGFSCVLERD
jgi:acetyl-CoA C-acetyltransferase